MSREEAINILIKGSDTNKISDGYHTFEELYEHRIELFITLCRVMKETKYTKETTSTNVWKSMFHSDGTSMVGWFIMGIGSWMGHQITYHLPIKYWEETNFAETMANAPVWDGHDSPKVLERLRKL